MEHMSTYFFGIYDYMLGYYSRISTVPVIASVDHLNSKNHPERMIHDGLSTVYSLSNYIENIIVKIENFKNVSQYYHESSCTHRLHDIKIPLFFLSSFDDPILGNKTIPIDKCYENIFLGVTKAGGHIGFFEGFLCPSG